MLFYTNMLTSPTRSSQVETSKFTVEFDPSGRLLSVGDKKVEQSWGFYTSFDADRTELGATPQPQGDYLAWTPGVPGTCLPGYLDAEGDEERWLRDSDGQNSGAYIFRPSKKDEKLTDLAPQAGRVKVVETDLVTEVTAEFGEWVKQITRVGKDSNYVEIEWTVGPVPTDDNVGKEVVMKFSTDIKNSGTFYTDSNGREFLERKLDFRPTWDMEVFQPVAGNYYPVNAAIYIEDSESSISVLNDRTQGGASLADGEVRGARSEATAKTDSKKYYTSFLHN